MRTLAEICKAISTTMTALDASSIEMTESWRLFEAHGEAHKRAYWLALRKQRRLEDERRTLREEAYRLIAEEMLPKVLDGTWKFRSGSTFCGPLKYEHGSSALIDHPTSYVQVKAGRGGRRRYAYLAEPYPNDKQPAQPAFVEFSAYNPYGGADRVRRMVAVPLGTESPYYPGATVTFVVAEADLVRSDYQPRGTEIAAA